MNWKLKDGITKEFFKNTKIRVNPAESRILQNELFKLGVFWLSGIDKPSYLNFRYLIIGKSISCEENEPSFNQRVEREIFFNDIFEPCENESQLQVAAPDCQHMTEEQTEIMNAINSPRHYGGENNPYEVIKVIKEWGLLNDALLFNVIKYIARAGKKDKNKELEDLKKAQWYLEYKIKQLES